MSLKHVTDDDFQLLLDEKQQKKNKDIQNHLKSCRVCQKQMNAYQYVEKEMKAEPKEVFSSDFENTVIKKIHNLRSKHVRIKLYLLTGTSFFVLVGLIIGMFFINPYRNAINTSLNKSWNIIYELLKPVIQLVEKLDLNSSAFLFGLMIVFFWGTLEKIIFPQKISGNV